MYHPCWTFLSNQFQLKKNKTNKTHWIKSLPMLFKKIYIISIKSQMNFCNRVAIWRSQTKHEVAVLENGNKFL